MTDHSANHEKIDWQAVWSSLGWEDSASGDEASRQRLRQRARQYAAPKAESVADSTNKTVLTFTLGEEHYGVDVMVVRSVRSVSHITRVPGVPLFYRGVVNVRGQVMTVLDLRAFFDMPVDDEPASEYELVVVRGGQLTLGLLAHHVEGVVTIPQADIGVVDHIRYAAGVTADRLVLLDVERLFEDQRLVVGGKED